MLRWDGSAPGRDAILPVMSEPPYRLTDLGDRRVLTVNGHEYATAYSARVIRMLIERKGIERTPPYLTYKETRGPHFLGPLFHHLRMRRARRLSVLEVGCSFGHMTEYVAEQPEVAAVTTFDTDPPFVALTRAKVEELGLAKVHEVALLGNREACRLPWADWPGCADVTEEAGYGGRFFHDTARSRTRRALLPVFAACVALLRAAGRPPSLCLPYLNLLIRKAAPPAR